MTPISIDTSIWGVQLTLSVETEQKDPPAGTASTAGKQKVQRSEPAGISRQAMAYIAGGSGAPEIDMFAAGCSAEDLINLISRLTGDALREQMNGQRQDLERNQVNLRQMNDEKAKCTQDWIKKCVSAHKNDKANKIFKILKIAGFALASTLSVGITAATAGAGSPLMMLSLTAFAQSMANEGLVQSGKSPVGLAKATKLGMSKMLEACGESKEDADKHGELMSGTIGTYFGGAMIDSEYGGQTASAVLRECGTGEEKAGYAFIAGAAVASLVGPGVASKTGKAAVAVASAGQLGRLGARAKAVTDKYVVPAACYAQGGAAVTNSAVGISDGALHIETAKAQRDADDQHADSQEDQAEVERIDDRVQRSLELMPTIMSNVQKVYEFTSDAAKGNANCRAVIANNTLTVATNG